MEKLIFTKKEMNFQ